ncbi:hypothetical protein [Rhodobacter ferrooxidans]|uniref:Uncharacterized protein n=1 Tax=Rhodobacter ferrooxidans TaxID=371731 RepID=C8RWA2_9RHOB|nr:hypothetical protein [Rhodobacter sp. SW2]EEW26845.1 hypothetical protein Rsw2DRAFT_0080 [Rhodobacter sp. SW2]
MSDWEDLVNLINSRGHAGVFAQQRGILERRDLELSVALEWARSAAAVFGLDVTEIRSNPADPPDCVASVNGRQVGIELTELVDGELLAELKFRSEQDGRRITSHHSTVFMRAQWDEMRFRAYIDRLLDKKAAKAKVPFDFLVVYSAETYLSCELVRQWMTNAPFAPRAGIGAAHFLMDYVPGVSEHWPVFRLY